MNKNIYKKIKEIEMKKGKPTLQDMNVVRNLFITDIPHNIFSSTPNKIKNCNRLTELDLIPCFDGLMVESCISNSTAEMIFKFLKPFIYKGNCDNLNIKKNHELLLDYMKIFRLANNCSLLNDNYTYIPKMSYKSSIIKNGVLDLTTANGDSMDMVQNATINLRRADNYWRLGVWVNPNKFIRNGKLQDYEPILWFIKQMLYPKLLSPYIAQIHSNIDVGIDFKNIAIFDEKSQEWKIEDFWGSFYLNNIFKNNTCFGNYSGKTTDTLAIYNKTNEIKHKTSNSYISPEELNILKANDIGVTRFELRSYNPKTSSLFLKNNTFIDDHFSLFLKYKDENGLLKRKRFKDSLNKAFKQTQNIVTDFTLVTDEILLNTYNAKN